MPERPDLRKIAGDIREALTSYPREALVEILTYVFQAYVVEGAPTVQVGQPERLTELEGLAFPDLIQALQMRLDVPELGLLEVTNGRVHVRVGGELQPLLLSNEARRQAAAPLSPPAPPSAPTAAPGSPGTGTVAAPTRPAPPAAQAEAPRPRGISISSGGGRPVPVAAAATPAAAAGAPKAAPAAPKTTEEPADDDAASRRFKLLEID